MCETERDREREREKREREEERLLTFTRVQREWPIVRFLSGSDNERNPDLRELMKSLLLSTQEVDIEG